MSGKDRLSRAALFDELHEVRQFVAGAFSPICGSIQETLHFQLVADIFGRPSAGVPFASHSDKNPEDAGYATGLFVKSGVELGFIAWMIQVMVLAIRRWIFGSPKKESVRKRGAFHPHQD